MEKKKWSDLAKETWDKKLKPVSSLGVLEEIVVLLAKIQEKKIPKVDKKRILLFMASHGICEEGVNPYPQSIDSLMLEKLGKGEAAINALSKKFNSELEVYDVGIVNGVDNIENSEKNVSFFSKKVREGTRNFAKEEAMTFEEMELAISVGREAVKKAEREGVNIIAIGEIGIGNTTSSATIFSAIFAIDPSETVGRGSGANDKVLHIKKNVIKNALKLHFTFKEDPLKCLQKVGGFEIASMLGAILEARKAKIPVIVDGYITTASVALANLLDKENLQHLIFSHLSKEKAHKKILDKLGVKPILALKMGLGEGTGACMAFPIIDASLALFEEMGDL